MMSRIRLLSTNNVSSFARFENSSKLIVVMELLLSNNPVTLATTPGGKEVRLAWKQLTATPAQNIFPRLWVAGGVGSKILSHTHGDGHDVIGWFGRLAADVKLTINATTNNHESWVRFILC